MSYHGIKWQYINVLEDVFMNKIGLAVYGLNIYNARRRKKMLDTVDSGIEFLDILEGFLNEGKKEFDTDNHAETVFRVENTERNEIFNEEGQKLYSYISGVVKTGEFGTESELVNRKTKKVTHNKTIDEAEVMPFAFFVAMPCGNIKRGIIILQTEGRYGMKMSFEKRLKKYMRNLYPDLDFAIGTISPKEYIERYLRDGFLKEIRMIKYGIPNDVSERNGLSKKPDANIYEERIIHNPLGFLDAGAEKIRETLNNQRLFTSIVEVPGFDYDKLKFKFSQGKTNKTIDMTNLDSITIIEDITDKVGVKNGHPLYSAVKEEMKRTAEEYLNGMGSL